MTGTAHEKSLHKGSEGSRKVVFISPEFTIYCSGFRTLSSIVKKHGYESTMVFMPSLEEEYSNAIKQLIKICEGSLAVCITSMAISFRRAQQIAKLLRCLNIPIIMGGIHATLNPESCLEYSDFVILGESEAALLELLKCIRENCSAAGVRNIAYKLGDKVIKNEVRELIKNINALPFPDYDRANKFIYFHGQIVPLTDEHFVCGEHNVSNIFFVFFNATITYHTMRGCPYNCKYCCNYDLKKIYRHKGRYVRFLSVRNLVQGVKYIIRHYPKTEIVWFTDDDFFIRGMDEIKKFSVEYKRHINLPFMCYLTPKSIDEEKLKHLLVAGLRRVEVGIQTGSEHTNKEIYSRDISIETIMKMAYILNKYKDEMFPPEYQFINTNPLESEEDIIKTINLILNLPKPFRLKVFNMIFFPGSEFEKEYFSNKANKIGENFSDINYIDKFNHLRKGIKHKYYPMILSLMDGYCWNSKYGSLKKKYLTMLLNKKFAWINKKIPIVPFFLMYVSLNWKDPYWVLPSVRLRRISFTHTISRERKKRGIIDPKGFVPIKS